MKTDDSKSYKLRFSVVVGPLSTFVQDPISRAIAAEKEGFRPEEIDDVPNVLEMEGQGILIFDKADGEASHVCELPSFSLKPILTDTPMRRRCGFSDHGPNLKRLQSTSRRR